MPNLITWVLTPMHLNLSTCKLLTKFAAITYLYIGILYFSLGWLVAQGGSATEVFKCPSGSMIYGQKTCNVL